jgi:anti-anti-sigma regulatory factor
MLRITTHDDTGSTTLKLAGRLAGPWVTELERCWRAAGGAQRGRPLRLDLTEVTFIDAAGKQLLS